MALPARRCAISRKLFIDIIITVKYVANYVVIRLDRYAKRKTGTTTLN